MTDITPERTAWLRKLGGISAPMPPTEENPDWVTIVAGVLLVAAIVYLLVIP